MQKKNAWNANAETKRGFSKSYFSTIKLTALPEYDMNFEINPRFIYRYKFLF